MQLKIKIFFSSNDSTYELEKEINEWLEEEYGKVEIIKTDFSTADARYSIMIFYRIKRTREVLTEKKQCQ